MNLLEHYIKEVHSITDVSNKYKKYHWYRGETMYEVVMTVDCYGYIEVCTHTFTESQWADAQVLGYYLA